MRGWAAAVLAAAVSYVAPNARADNLRLLPAVMGTSEIWATGGRTGLALGGWDPVSYLVDGSPRPGSALHEAIWEGVVWRFASAANRAAFLADPAAFAPRLGGYDAAALASGTVADADPRLFVVREGALYLFRTEAGRAGFAPGDAAPRAEAAWRRVRVSLVGG